MREAVWLSALCAVAGSCGDDELSRKGLATSGAALHASPQGPSEMRSALCGYRVTVPEGVTWRQDFVNPDPSERASAGAGARVPGHVIRERVIFQGPTQAHVVVDAWDNPKRLALGDWLSEFGKFALYSDIVERSDVREGRGRHEAVLAVTDAEQAPRRELVVLDTGPHIVRIMYVDTDGGASREIWRGLVDTFEEGGAAP